MKIKPDERIDDLNRCGYKIIQNTKKFCFGMDAVLLSSFAKANEGNKVVDLGTGTGIIPILMEAKTKASSFIGLEIQEESVDMATRSVVMNNQQDKITIKQGDIKTASKDLGAAMFDVVHGANIHDIYIDNINVKGKYQYGRKSKSSFKIYQQEE